MNEDVNEKELRPGENPHSGNISGYRRMTDEEVELINEIKQAERETAAIFVRVADIARSRWPREGISDRWASIAKTHMEQGFMALVRSVAQPQSPFEG